MISQNLLEEWGRLTRAEQIEFVCQADDFFDDEDFDGSDLPQELKDLLDARIAAYEANPTGGCTLEELRAHLDERLKCLRS